MPRKVDDAVHHVATYFVAAGESSYTLKPRYDYLNRWGIPIDIDGAWTRYNCAAYYNAIGADDIDNIAAGGSGYIEKTLPRLSIPDIGVAMEDIIYADLTLKRHSDLATLMTMRAVWSVFCNRRVGNPSLWNFDDGTWQGWTRSNVTYVTLTTSVVHSSPYAVRCYLSSGDMYIYRNFDFFAETLTGCTLTYWGRRDAANTRVRCWIIDNLTGAELFVSDDAPTLNTWTQYSKDILLAVQGKDAQIRLGAHNVTSGWANVYIDDIALYCTYT